MTFLESYDFIPIALNINIRGLYPENLFIGKGDLALEIAVFSSSNKPNNSLVHKAFNLRRGGRATPVLVVVSFQEGVVLCGTNGEKPRIYELNDIEQVERLCANSLLKSDRNSAINYLTNSIPTLETELPGFLNESFLSNHELIQGTKLRKDWEYSIKKSKELIRKSDREMIKSLGFKTEKIDNLTELLINNEDSNSVGVAVFLEDNEIPQVASERFNNISPIAYALTKADRDNLSWVLMLQGEKLRLYNTKSIGVGGRSRTETFIECQISLMKTSYIGLIWLLFSKDALIKNGTIQNILEESKRFAADIATNLRERIYSKVVPMLALGISKARDLKNPSKEDIELTYEMTLTVLFRLLFIAYGEDRDLLPYKNNEIYRSISLKEKATELAKNISDSISINDGFNHWKDTYILWSAVEQGNKELGLPAYGGTIFSSNESISKAGYELSKIKLNNKYYEEALRNILITNTEKNIYLPLDFRSLSVREFGTIYEGLLESELSIATENLSVDKKGNFVPCLVKEKLEVKKGEIYLHNHSGARKSSGSYYTPDFVVDHLLNTSLEPALDFHLQEISLLSEAEQAEQLFDFRVADIAMGSGHFLVAAIDKIEKRFALWLEDNPIPGIKRELSNLREVAKKQLGDLAETVVIDESQLLRRMIAKRCIYGIDLNPITVQLSRLSIWIHTFVPGLPLSLLDHNLVYGNALIGVDSIDLLHEKLNRGQGTLFQINADELLQKAAEPLKKLAIISDASLGDINEGRALMNESFEKIRECKALCDLITAQAISNESSIKGFLFENWKEERLNIKDSDTLKLAEDILEPLDVIHFPIAFPEVFLGKSKGFNVILGNPPWETIKIEEQKFWAQHFPGIRSLSQKDFAVWRKDIEIERKDLVKLLSEEQEKTAKYRQNILSGNYPGLGSGDPDLYKAFAWRFWNICSKKNGLIGIVMPRSAMALKGASEFRKELFNKAQSLKVVTLINKGRWIFDIHAQWSISLLSICKPKNLDGIYLLGPFNSYAKFSEGVNHSTKPFSRKEFLTWTDTASIPIFPEIESIDIFHQIRKSPRLDYSSKQEWRARPDREMDSTNQKNLMNLEMDCLESGYWPVYKGESFDLWNPETGKVYGYAKKDKALAWLYEKRKRSWKGSRGVHSEFSKDYIEDKKTLAPMNPRIAIRKSTNRTNSRTMIASLVPPEVFLQDGAQYLIWPNGSINDQIFLLGILSSIPLDWFSRMFVEMNFNFFLINPLPIPRPLDSNPLKKRVIELAGRLAFIDDRYINWAKEVKTDYGPLESSLKKEYIYELDALACILYSLKENDIIHIFKTFHEGWNYEFRMNQVIKHYKKWISRI